MQPIPRDGAGLVRSFAPKSLPDKPCEGSGRGMSAKMWGPLFVVCALLTAHGRHVADARPLKDVREHLPVSPVEESQEEDEFSQLYADFAKTDAAAADQEKKSLLDLPQAQGIDNTIYSPGRSWEPNTITGQNGWDFNRLGFSNELYPSPFDEDNDIFPPLPEKTTPPPPPPSPGRQLSMLRLAEKIRKLELRMSSRRADISRELTKEAQRRKELELVIRRQGKLIRELRVKNKYLRDMVGEQEDILRDLREDEQQEEQPQDSAPSQRFNRAAWSAI